MIVLDTNACLSGPCLNGGTCQAQNNGNSYTCSCAPGYSGTTCQICKYYEYYEYYEAKTFIYSYDIYSFYKESLYFLRIFHSMES